MDESQKLMEQDPLQDKMTLLVTVLLVFAVALCLYCVVQVLSHGYVNVGGFMLFRVVTGSMEPTIHIDDLIIVMEQEDYKEHDVVVYQSGTMLVAHRIIELQPDTVITQGDANNAPDAPIRKEMIKGKVVLCIPAAGSMIRLLKSPVATVVLVGGALLLSELTLRKEKKKDEDELEQIKAEIRRLKAEQE